MQKGILYRALLILALILWAVVSLVPSTMETVPDWWSSILPSRKIRLGLDLRGGTHLLLSVDMEKALENALDQNAEELRRAIREANIAGVDVQRVEKSLRVRPSTQEAKNSVEKLLSDQFPILKTEGRRLQRKGRWHSSLTGENNNAFVNMRSTSPWKQFVIVLTSLVLLNRQSNGKGVRTS